MFTRDPDPPLDEIPVVVGSLIAPAVSEGFETFDDLDHVRHDRRMCIVAVGATGGSKCVMPQRRRRLQLHHEHGVDGERDGIHRVCCADVVCTAGSEPFDGPVHPGDLGIRLRGRSSCGGDIRSPEPTDAIPDVDMFTAEYTFRGCQYDVLPRQRATPVSGMR